MITKRAEEFSISDNMQNTHESSHDRPRSQINILETTQNISTKFSWFLDSVTLLRTLENDMPNTKTEITGRAKL